MKIKASTISVMSRGSNTVHCYVELDGESFNLTLRFDRGDVAALCGYPREFRVHDESVDPYGDSELTYKDYFEEGMIDDGETYVSEDTEIEILKRLKKSLERQFNDCSWMDHELSLKFQLSVLNKINNAITKLKGA